VFSYIRYDRCLFSHSFVREQSNLLPDTIKFIYCVCNCIIRLTANIVLANKFIVKVVVDRVVVENI
jgi:hypothetical protein